MISPTVKVRELGFPSSVERHQWVMKHAQEILDYYSKNGRMATIRYFHIGTSTLDKLRKGHWNIGTTATPKPKATSGTPFEKIQQEPQILVLDPDTFFNVMAQACTKYFDLKAEVANLKKRYDEMVKIAGKFSELSRELTQADKR